MIRNKINSLLYPKTVSESNNDKYYIHFIYDKKQKTISLLVDYDHILNKYSEDINLQDSKFIEDAEEMAQFLHTLCNDRTFVSSLVLDNLKEFKENTKSDGIKYNLFIDNIFMFLNGILFANKTKKETNNPVIKPTKVFRNA